MRRRSLLSVLPRSLLQQLRNGRVHAQTVVVKSDHSNQPFRLVLSSHMGGRKLMILFKRSAVAKSWFILIPRTRPSLNALNFCFVCVGGGGVKRIALYFMVFVFKE